MSIFGGLGGMVGNLLDQYGGPEAVVGRVLTQMGGVQGVLAKLRQAGFGGQVASWLGTDANQPISPEQIANALGHGPLADVAGKFGLSPDQLTQVLAHALPSLVDRISPNGQLQPHLLDAGAAGGASPVSHGS